MTITSFEVFIATDKNNGNRYKPVDNMIVFD